MLKVFNCFDVARLTQHCSDELFGSIENVHLFIMDIANLFPFVRSPPTRSLHAVNDDKSAGQNLPYNVVDRDRDEVRILLMISRVYCRSYFGVVHWAKGRRERAQVSLWG